MLSVERYLIIAMEKCVLNLLHLEICGSGLYVLGITDNDIECVAGVVAV